MPFSVVFNLENSQMLHGAKSEKYRSCHTSCILFLAKKSLDDMGRMSRSIAKVKLTNFLLSTSLSIFFTQCKGNIEPPSTSLY